MPDTPDIQTTQPNQFKIISSVFAVLITILIVLGRESISHFSAYGYIGVFLVSFIGNATILMPLPIMFSIAAIGAALNPLFVGMVASLGAAFGESVGYFLGLGGNIVIEKSVKYQKAKSYIDRYGYWAIFILAALPNPLFDLAGIMAGAAGISYKQFFFSVWTGTFIKYTLFAVVGFKVITG